MFGVDPGGRFERLRVLLTNALDVGASPSSMIPALQRGRRWQEFVRQREEVDSLLFDLIGERRREGAEEERDDMLAMLLAARHEDGSPMSQQELRDELMTLLVAGHETTASELSWALERLARTPAVLHTLTEEIDGGDGEAYLTATVQETLRRRPVLPNSAPRLVMEPVEIGGWTYPTGIALAANAYLIHHDPAIYPDPYAFRPERFLGSAPGTYTWIPFGGGRRRASGELRATRDEDRAEGVARHERDRPWRGGGADAPAKHHDQPSRRRAHDPARPRAPPGARAGGRVTVSP